MGLKIFNFRSSIFRGLSVKVLRQGYILKKKLKNLLIMYCQFNRKLVERFGSGGEKGRRGGRVGLGIRKKVE